MSLSTFSPILCFLGLLVRAALWNLALSRRAETAFFWATGRHAGTSCCGQTECARAVSQKNSLGSCAIKHSQGPPQAQPRTPAGTTQYHVCRQRLATHVFDFGLSTKRLVCPPSRFMYHLMSCHTDVIHIEISRKKLTTLAGVAIFSSHTQSHCPAACQGLT